jgi:TonB family protein
VKALSFLLLTVLAVSVPSAVAQDATASTGTATFQSEEGFTSFLSSLQNVVSDSVSSKKTDKLDAGLRAMEIPGFQAWFASSFGPENGRKMAEIYSESLTKWASRLRDALLTQAEPGGQVAASTAYGGPQPQSMPIAERVDKAIRESLLRPATFYLVQYTWKSAKTGYPYAVPFGYATLVDGSYRVIPENVMRALPNMPALRLRQGGALTAANLISRVQPVYPAEARRQRVSGNVRLHAVIGRDGSIESLEVVSGDQLLLGAALDAVRQWRYRPTTLQGEPVEIDTTIDVIFGLSR